MNLLDTRHALRFDVGLRLATPLLLRSGETGEFTDSSIDRTPDGRLFVNGYVWASLVRRCLARLSSGGGFAGRIGKYRERDGVSPLWCEPSIASLCATTVSPGIRVSRAWGAPEPGALFSDELAAAGIPLSLRMTVFCADADDAAAWQEALEGSLRVVHEGIENIGGGWSYGYGRLCVEFIRFAPLDLATERGRRYLWGSPEGIAWQERALPELDVSGGWSRIDVQARVAEGQLLAVRSDVLPMQHDAYGRLPDTFVFRRDRVRPDGTLVGEPVIPGKAIRQALLSVPLERKWRSLGNDACAPVAHVRRDSERDGCACSRCRWFGSTDTAGILAVTDAPVREARTCVVSRVQLCEHSMQNMNLLSGEYLSGGFFDFTIFIDESRPVDAAGLLDEVMDLLEEMRGVNSPPGWYRLGGTSTCTGQVRVVDYTVTRSKQV